mgnify:CR=1 FL=1
MVATDARLATAVGHANTYNRLPLNIAVADFGLVLLAGVGFRLARIGAVPPGYARLGRGLLLAMWVYIIGQVIGSTGGTPTLSSFVPAIVDIYPVLIAYSLIPVTRLAGGRMDDGGSVVTLTFHAGEKVYPGYNIMGVAKAALEAAVTASSTSETCFR